MVMQGLVESKESKGFIINLGLKDKAKGFAKFSKTSADDDVKVGSLVQVIVQGKTSKVIRCQFLTQLQTADENAAKLQQVKTDLATVTPHTLKPGFSVSAKVQKLFTNGIEVSFLGGMTGTIFADHIVKSNPSKYKVGEKVTAVVISQDISSKATALTLKPSLLKLEEQKKSCEIGQLYSQVKVEKKVYGNSYLIRLDSHTVGLLHKSNIPKPEELQQEEEDKEMANEETKDLSSDDAAKKMAAKKKAARKHKAASKQMINEDKDDLLDIGKVLPEVRVKEFNYFDGMPILSMMPNVVANGSPLDYKNLRSGDTHTATIDSVDSVNKKVILKLNDFVKGFLNLEHMADHPLKVIPPKFTTIGKEIKVRVFNIDGRHVEFTKKDSLLKEDAPVYQGTSELSAGNKLLGVVVSKTEHGFIVRSFAGLKGLLTHTDVKENGAKLLKAGEIKSGTAVKCYVQFVKKGSGIALTLSKKKATAKNPVIEGSNDSLAEKHLPAGEELEALKTSYATVLKNKSSAILNEVTTYRVCESRSTYYVVKTLN